MRIISLRPQRRRCRQLALLLSSLLLLSGCAHTVTFPAQRPAAAPIQGMRALVVLPVAGPPASGQQAQEKLIARLRQNPDYHLVDVADLDRTVGISPHYRGGPPTLQDRLAAARFLGVDTLVEARLRPDSENSYSVGFANVTIGDQRLAVHLDVMLIDVVTGRMRGEWTTTKTFVGELSSNPKNSGSEPRVLERLAGECGEQAAEGFAPREDEVKVRLASGWSSMTNSEVRAGVAAARAGNWQTAKLHFAKAHEDAPEDPAALYNLAVAHEATNDFAAARQLYEQAVELDDDARYSAGLKRVETSASEYELAMLQRAAKQAPSQTGPGPQPGQPGGPWQPANAQIARGAPVPNPAGGSPYAPPQHAPPQYPQTAYAPPQHPYASQPYWQQPGQAAPQYYPPQPMAQQPPQTTPQPYAPSRPVPTPSAQPSYAGTQAAGLPTQYSNNSQPAISQGTATPVGWTPPANYGPPAQPASGLPANPGYPAPQITPIQTAPGGPAYVPNPNQTPHTEGYAPATGPLRQ